MHNTEIQRLMHENATMRGLLLWTLYHHQGGSSAVGQPIRKALGIGEHAHLTAEQITEAKKYGEPCKHKNRECTYESDDGEFERWQCKDCGERWGVEIAQ